MSLQCVILAGGLGTRMRPLTDRIPKALVPVLGRPFADWQLRHLVAQGVERVVYSIAYRGEMLREFVGDGSRYGLTVSYVDEGERLLGTGGALRLALDAGVLDGAFFVLYGDSFLPADARWVELAWRDSGLPELMTVMRNDDRWDSSNAVYADGRVLVYDKSRPESWRQRMRWIDYGLSVLTRRAIADRVAPGAAFDLAEVLRQLSLAGRLAGLEVTERFYEVGSPEGVRELEGYLSAGPSVRPSQP
jgi:NDP-sugar pyrophosphorylase family protein